MGVSKKRMLEIEKYLSKENLEKYLPLFSANYIATELFYPDFKSTAGTVIDRAKAFGIKSNSISESANLQSVRKSYTDTCYNKYGVKNVSQNEEIKKKKEQSSIDKYGTINVFQSEKIKAKSRKTCLEKYGTEYAGRFFLKNSGTLSKFHIKISKILESLNIQYKNEVPGLFLAYNNFLQKEYSPVVDILIEDKRLVIECNGDFWHANPKMYKDSDIFHTWEGTKTAKEIQDKDKSRISQIESFGYNVLVIWESEFNHNKQDIERKIIDAIKNC